MSAIDFVVRGDAGVSQRGSLSGADGASMVVGAGQDVSLNLTRGDILSYVRQGQALEVTLVDGSVMTIQGFFSPNGEAVADLFISANGTLAQAELVAGEGNLLFAQYVDADSFGKWSPDDDLYFVRGSDVQLAGVVPADDASAGMLGSALLGGIAGIPALGAGAAVLGGTLLLAGTGGSSGEGDGVSGASGSGTDEPDTSVDPDAPDEPDIADEPTIDPPVVTISDGTAGADHTVNAEDYVDGVEIGGTGTPNTSGTITVGDITKDITTDEEGDWTAKFTQEEVAGGEYEEEVTVTLTNDGGTTTSTDTLVIDTVASVTIDTSIVETNGEINLVEESDGFALTGTVEAGSTVTVTFGDVTYDAVVTGSEWSLAVDAGVIVQGEYDLNISVDAIDAHGNTASTSGTVAIDTITSLTLDDSVGGEDGVVNAVEHSGGIELNGLAEGGASVVVTLGTVTHTVTASANGEWSTIYASAELPTGQLDTYPVSAISTDLAGNTASASGSVTIDTEIDVTVTENAGGSDSVVNAVERGDTITLSGETDLDASVVVSFNGVPKTVTAGSDGSWSADYAASSIPQNAEGVANVSVTATDAVGNTASAATTVDYDTFVNRLEFTGGKVEGDDVINKEEASDGVTLTGVVEIGSSVVVSFGGVENAATVNSAGAWTVDFSAAEIATVAAGQSDAFAANIVVKATDIAGNTAEISDTVQVDLVAPGAADVVLVGTEEAGASLVQLGEASPDVTFDQFVNGASTAQVVNLEPGAGPVFFNFEEGSVVPDGSHLLVTNNDDAGNSTSTLVVLQDTSSFDLSAGALGDFNISEINLETTNGVNLEITADQLKALSADTDELVVHGDDNDSVVIADLVGETASGTKEIGSQTYDVYDLGGDASLIIDQAITLNPVV